MKYIPLRIVSPLFVVRLAVKRVDVYCQSIMASVRKLKKHQIFFPYHISLLFYRHTENFTLYFQDKGDRHL